MTEHKSERDIKLEMASSLKSIDESLKQIATLLHAIASKP